MSDTYMPTTEEVRDAYANFFEGHRAIARRRVFKRWLDAYAAQVRAETLAPIITARTEHPACDVHPDDDPVSCGWKRAVLGIDAALAASPVHDEGEKR